MKRRNISITEKYQMLKKMEEIQRTEKSIADECAVKKNAMPTCITNKKKTWKRTNLVR